MSGWFQHEHESGRSYRWATGHAAVIVRLAKKTSSVHHELPPAAGLDRGFDHLRARGDLEHVLWSTRIAWHDQAWHEDSFPLRLAAGDYVVAFDAEEHLVKPRLGEIPPSGTEDRSLGFALSSLSFDEVA